MQNITLQTSDSDLTTNEVLGRLAFAASNDSSGSDAILIAASVYARAESEFTVSSNATSLVFATASSEAATNKLRITSEGHFIPFTSGQYDLGSSAYPFRALHVDTSVYSPSGSFDYLVFNTGIADADLSTGQVAWGNEAGTLEIGLTDDVKIQVGQTVLFRVKNSTGSALSKGQAVYASGVLGGGQIIQAAKFTADESVDEVRFIGLMTNDLANGEDGFVNHFGHIKNVDLRTSNTAVNPNGETWAVGDILYVDGTTAGGLTKVPPQDDIYVALVLEDGQNGELFVRITDPGHITDLHDVNMSGLVDNNLMVWNSGSNYWEPTTSMTFNGTTLHTDTDGITAIFGRNNAQTQGGKVRIYVDDNDTAGSVQAIKAFNAKTTGTNFGINATANGLGATKNVGLYGWAAQATTNWGLWVDAGYGIFDDKVGIKTQSPTFDLHVNGSGYFANDVYYDGDLVIGGDLFVNGSGIIGDIAIVDNTISSLSGNLLLFPECSGYVGVNTDDPNAMLHVYSATSGDNVFNVEGTNGSLFSVVDNLSGTLMSVNTIAGLPVLEVNSDYSVTAGRFNKNDFVIASNGDIGMGIAAPSGKLHIYDNNSAGYNDTSFRIQNPASPNNTYFDIAIGTSTGYGDNVWFKRNGVNVAGIYSSNMFYHYQDCVIRTDKQFRAESNGNAFIELLDGSNDTKIGYLSDLRFYSSGSEKMVLDVNGNLGIGTATPSAKLDVNGSVNVANDVIVGGNVTINGTTVTANAESMQVKDPIITLGLASGNVITNDTYDRGLALVTNNGTAFMGWDNSADKFVMLSSGVATNSSGNYDAGTYGDLHIGKLIAQDDDDTTFTNPGTISLKGNTDRPYISFHGDDGSRVGYLQINKNQGANINVEVNQPLLFRTNNNIRMTIDEGGDVGIGTASPTTLLDVSGVITASGGNSNEWNQSYDWINASGTANVGGSAYTVPFWNSTADALTYSSDLTFNSSNRLTVGNGTANYKFNVYGDAGISSTLYAAGFAFFGDGLNAIYKYTNSLTFSTSTPDRDFSFGSYSGSTYTTSFYINNGTRSSRAYNDFFVDGNLGVGTTSPTTKLDVSGVITASGGNSDQWNEAYDWIQASGLDGTGAASGVAFWTDANTLSNDSALIWDSTNNRLGIGTATPSKSLHIVKSTSDAIDSFIRLENNGRSVAIDFSAGVGGVVDTSQITFDWWGNSYGAGTSQGMNYKSGRAGLANHWFRDDTNAVQMSILDNGNVGIGTSAPGQKLDIRYPAGGGMALLKSTDTNDGLLFGDMAYSSDNSYQGIKHAAMTGTSDYMMISNGGDTIISAANTYNTLIRAGGNNTTGEIKVRSTEVVINDNSSSSDFRVESNNNANMLFVDGVSDMVGIGTGSPNAQLNVYAAGTTGWKGMVSAGNENYRFVCGVYGDKVYFGGHTANHLAWADALIPGGKLGIGTTGPVAKTHIYNNSAYEGLKVEQIGTSYAAQYVDTDGYGVLVHTAATTSTHYLLNLKSDSGNQNVMRVGADGKIGIGTASPSTQLDVIGSGNFTGDVTIDGHLSAATKSFLINHPTREGHKLQYGSLESPYHGVRLTGRAKVENGWCVVKLPEYISELVHNNNDINIQITNIKHSKVLYVDDTNIANNEFTVKTDSWFNRSGLEFFWTFTAVRKDVKELQVEF